jgi:glycerol transport system permease protein
MRKSTNQRAWWLVAPVLLLVAFNAFIPLMTVVNYSLQETFGDNVFFWEGVTWFEKVLRSERFHDSLLRQLLFTGMIIVIEVPLGIAVALSMPRKGPWVSVCLVLMALPSVERGRGDVEHFCATRHRSARLFAELDGI